jgi:hypothetical protein
MRRLQAERANRMDSHEGINDNDSVVTNNETGIAQTSRFNDRPDMGSTFFKVNSVKRQRRRDVGYFSAPLR